ncbi:MAG: TatD family hydrolase [Candidatus Woesearchaeota archaeon]|nr:TatD family hydrolase [Nanoarchaeota archaeon]USN44301.1 MAG: TatD family hydrolase [Candidatus Woesearchaeota archaeon]
METKPKTVTLVDVHCHLDMKHFDKDREELVQTMKREKIIALTNTISPDNYLYTKQLFEAHAGTVKVCPGLYPTEAHDISDKDLQEYCQQLRQCKEDFVGIGEIGLDKHESNDEKLFEKQKKGFRAMIELAIELDKPCFIHTRKAESEVLDILAEYVEEKKFKKFCLHCFMGKKKLIKRIKELGLYCSIPLIVLNTQSFQHLVEELPLTSILVETDSPFLNPSKERNSPLNIPLIYDEIARIKGYDKVELPLIVYNNYRRITL